MSESLAFAAARPGVLAAAWSKVALGGRTVGCDGIRARDWRGARLGQEIERLGSELRTGAYRPLPSRVVWLRKAGASERRRIAIPALRDRVAQVATLRVVGPLFERRAEPCSHAYRPRRGVATAAAHLGELVRGGRHWIVESDISGCFDNLPHDGILREFEAVVDDVVVGGWARSWMQADLVERGRVARLLVGVPQGAPISPLLSNAFLGRLDRAWSGRTGECGLVRYADDLVLACRSEPQAWLQRLKDAVEGLGLSLKESKTRIAHAREGIDFLGMHFRLVSGSLGEHFLRWPSERSVETLITGVRRDLRSPRCRSIGAAIQVANARLRPWLRLHVGEHVRPQIARVEEGVMRALAEWADEAHDHRHVRVRQLRRDWLARRGLLLLR